MSAVPPDAAPAGPAPTLALEWRLCWRAGGTRAVLAAFVLALAAAAVTGLGHVAGSRAALTGIATHEVVTLAEQRATTLALDRGELATVGARNDPRDPATFGNQLIATWAVQPPQPLAALAVGQSDLHPRYVRLVLGARDKAAGSAELASPEALLSGPFDLAFVLVYLLPLALIALCHGVAAGDRERGIAPLLEVASARPERVWRDRLLLRFGLVYGVAAAATVTIGVAGAGGAGAVPWPALAAVLLALAVYAAFWTALCGYLGRHAPGAGASALRLVSAWVALLLVVPAIANAVARSVAPVPARAEFVQALRDATDRIDAERAAVLDRFLFDHPELAQGADATTLPAGLARLVTTRAVEAEAARIEARYEAQLARQQRVLAVFEALSPPLALQSLLERVAGADLDWQRDFERRTAEYHERLRDFFAPLLRASPPVAVAVPGERPHFGFPRFAPEPSAALAWPRPGTLLGLLVALLAAVALAWPSTARRRGLGAGPQSRTVTATS